MKIAILGWGSLIWQPKDLNFDKSKGWKKDGVKLPIEFARISQNGRLTLVITPNGTEVPTLYAVSKYTTIEEAVLDLAVREGTDKFKDYKIGYYNKQEDEFCPNDFKYKKEIKEWINTTDFNAVIWTNLGENWKEKTDNRIEHLKSLKEETQSLAEEYIRKTPVQINTAFRKEIEKELNWKPIILPNDQ